MKWWTAWKAKHWDEEMKDFSGRMHMGVHFERPPLRRVAGWFAKHWREQPMTLIGAFAGLIAAVAALIQALR